MRQGVYLLNFSAKPFGRSRPFPSVLAEGFQPFTPPSDTTLASGVIRGTPCLRNK
jgi:hypothetical protein